MARKITNIYEYINYFEVKFGNLNELFYAIFEGVVPNSIMMDLMYYYDCIDGFDMDFDEYDARYGDRPFEWKLEKMKVIAQSIIKTIKYSPDYKPAKGVVNRNKNVDIYKI